MAENYATSLVLIVSQIIEGEATCAYCDKAAQLTICTGADPEPEACCAKHALNFMGSTRTFIEQVFGS